MFATPGGCVGRLILQALLPAVLFACVALLAPRVVKQARHNPVAPDVFPVHDGDRVVFLGDSITARDGYPAFVEYFVRTRFPAWNVEFRNIGRGNDTAWLHKRGGLTIGLRNEVAPLQPDVLFVCYGMNDARGATENMLCYAKGLRTIAERCDDEGARVILLAPPVEQRSREGFPCGSEYNLVLDAYAGTCRMVAQECGSGFVNVRGTMERVIDLAHPLVMVPDGRHPDVCGHLVMAYAILRDLHAPAEVSAVELDAARCTVVSVAGAQVRGLASSDTGVSFTREDCALPWAPPEECAAVLDLPGFDPCADLSRMMLTVHGLSATARHVMTVDGQRAGSYTGIELERGVNLTRCHGPVYEQCMDLLSLIRERNHLFTEKFRLMGSRILHPQDRQSEDAAVKLSQDNYALESRMLAAAFPKPHRYHLRREG